MTYNKKLGDCRSTLTSPFSTASGLTALFSQLWSSWERYEELEDRDQVSQWMSKRYCLFCNWKPRAVMTPTLSSLIAPQVVITTTCGAIIDDNFFHHGDSRFSVTCLSLISLSFIARPRLIDWNPRLGRQCIEIFKRCDITSIYNGETKPSLDVSEVVIPKLASWRIQVFREPSHTVVPAQVWIIVIYVLE